MTSTTDLLDKENKKQPFKSTIPPDPLYLCTCPALRTRKVSEGDGKTKYNVSVDGVNFKCSKRLKELVKEDRPKKIKRDNIETDNIETRKNKMLAFLAQEESINEMDYATLNSCTRYRAAKDLKQFMDEGIIHKMGYKTHRIYVLSS